jgi:hypothetical protein
MPSYWVSEPYIDLRIEDIPLFYSPSRGLPIQLRLSYRQRGVVPEDPAVFGVGANWSCSFRSYLVDLTSVTPGWMRLHRGGAGLIDYTNNITQYRDGSLLTGSGGNFQIEYADGSKDVFQKNFVNADGTNFYFMTSQTDPAGNTLSYNYSSNPSAVQLLTVTDPDTKSTSLYYENATFPLQITKVVDPFNRTNLLQYRSDGYLLTNIDVIGMTNSFVYDTDPNRTGWITNLVTPYGTTAFEHGGADAQSATFFTTGVPVNRYITVTLPNGGHELYLYRQDCSAFLPAGYAITPDVTPLTMRYDNVDQW